MTVAEILAAIGDLPAWQFGLYAFVAWIVAAVVTTIVAAILGA